MAVTALRDDKTIAEKFEVHPNQVTDLKAQLVERSSLAFAEKADGTPAPNFEKMEAKIGSVNTDLKFPTSPVLLLVCSFSLTMLLKVDFTSFERL